MPQLKPPRGSILRKPDDSIVGRLIDGLVGCWLMNEGAGNTVFDLSGNGNDGTLFADTNWTSGKFGSCLNFDGTDDYVDCGTGDSLDITGTALTISAWFNVASVDTWDGLVVKSESGSYNEGYGINFHTTTIKFWVTHATDNFATADFTADGKWHHVIGVYDGATIKIWLDGALGSITDTYTGNILTASTALCIGRFSTGWADKWMTGKVDNVQIYNRALSASEIALLCWQPFCMFERRISPSYFFVEEAGGLSIPVAINQLRTQKVA